MGQSGYYLLTLECDRYPDCVGVGYEDFDRERSKKQAAAAGWILSSEDDLDTEDICPKCAPSVTVADDEKV